MLDCDLCPPDPDHRKLCPQWSEVDYVLHLKLMHECELCKMLCQSYMARETHYERIHGKRYRYEEWLEIVGNEAISRYGRFVTLNEWRNPVELLADLPTDPADLCRWLYPMCLRMVECSRPEAALFSPPDNVGSQALYIEANFPTVLKLSQTARFNRLKSAEAKSRLLAAALAMPNNSPGYAEQLLRGSWPGDAR